MTTALRTTYDFHCYGCGHSEPAAPHGVCCPQCREPLSLRSLATPPRALFDHPPASMWHYAPLLPVDSADAVTPARASFANNRDRASAPIVTLGEGATPLLDAPRLAERYGFAGLTLKNEATNPTGSFKDRQVSVGITHAQAHGFDTVAVVSSGNVACAAAAYAARAGKRAILFMHGLAGPGKTAQAAAYGGQIVQVQSPSARAVFELCLEACDRFGWYHLSTAGLYQPYNVEGAKTIAYELFYQYAGDLPDWIVMPVGGGGILGGVWRGFLDLQRLGILERIPRLAGVQASGCAPLVKALESNWSFLESLEHPWPNPDTIAGGIADDILFDGHTALPAIRTTRGAAFAVDDDAILDGELELASTEGILVEPTCACVIAALGRIRAQAKGQRVCCILTGAGIKELSAIAGRGAPPVRIGTSITDLEAALGDLG